MSVAALSALPRSCALSIPISTGCKLLTGPSEGSHKVSSASSDEEEEEEMWAAMSGAGLFSRSEVVSGLENGLSGSSCHCWL